MASRLTDVTELVTGLGMSGVENLDLALAHKPQQLRSVDDQTWARLLESRPDPDLATAFDAAWANGRAFLHAPDALRSRVPRRIEWRGGHKSKGDTSVPADLRIDHVFLISCKYLSKNIQSPSPHNLFNALLVEALKQHRTPDWYQACAPQAYQELYAAVRDSDPALADLPMQLTQLEPDQRQRLVAVAMTAKSASITDSYKLMARQVAIESSRIWNANLTSVSDRERMLWRLLRLQAAPYFLLGQAGSSTMRFRIATPWDWSHDYRFKGLSIKPDLDAGQPTVRWTAQCQDRQSGLLIETHGHIEIRWTHKKFRMPPEAKVYIDTPLAQLPGYHQLDDSATV